MTYREIDQTAEVERLRRRVRALERALRMTSPIRSCARILDGIFANVRKDPWAFLTPTLVIAALVAGGILVHACQGMTKRVDRCEFACAREGLELQSTAGGNGCICRPPSKPIRMVTP